MAKKKALAEEWIPVPGGNPAALHAYLRKYQARIYRDSGTEKGTVYWTPAANGMWMLAMRKGDKVRVTFHAPDDCPCQML